MGEIDFKLFEGDLLRGTGRITGAFHFRFKKHDQRINLVNKHDGKRKKEKY